ncbi:serine/threonine-protein kinase [Leptolyngbya sp. FACHB-261]|uniref:serine/threonine-protein kinase n=1 Tax=Leptolyngbya sp. FACHB-261 TaxID=2692806 RepID=UPI001683EA76|nr:serine/threonine-protein kinase [Leptolyngbya sp. FACHB-261]MBD2100309.1 serine/threonine protein kinase [Leptolyngbya sp. FACHB-261]
MESGTVLQDRYQIVRSLGKGGFGQTFEVKDKGPSGGRTSKAKVLKILTLDRFQESKNRQKVVALFQREAEVLIRLNHPGIPKVEPDGYFTWARQEQELLHCLVMEKIEGQNLRSWLRSRADQPILQDQAILWLKQLLDILNQLHHQELFHRDIKPPNIMLRPDGQMVLVDFGAVREITETYLQRQKGDETGTVIVSAGYTPPEQAEGRAVLQSDFFALGRTFVHLLTGQHPTNFDTDPRTGRLNWRDSAPQISKALAGLVDYLMEPFPGRRPQTAEEVMRCLAEVTANGSESTAFASSGSPPPQRPPLNRSAQSVDSRDSTPSRRSTPSRPNAIASFLPTLALLHPWQNAQFRRSLLGHLGSVRALAVSPDGEILASGGYDRTVKLWNLNTGEQLQTLSDHRERVTSLTISSDGKLLASGSHDRTIKLWNLATGDLIHTLDGRFGPIHSVAFDPKGQTLLSSSGTEIKLWAVLTGRSVAAFAGGSESIRSIAISPDGRLLAVGSLDGTVEFRHAQTGKLLHSRSAQVGGIVSLAFSPDGQLLASSSGTSIEIWGLRLGKRLHLLPSQSGEIASVAFSPDGQTLASSGGPAIDLWNLQTGRRLSSLTGHTSLIRSVVFSPVGRTLISGAQDKTIRIWQP